MSRGLTTVLGTVILSAAVVGTLSSTVFLGLALLGARKFLKQARLDREEVDRFRPQPLPKVSILKPLHGDEARLEENIESFFDQDYPEFEVLMAVDRADDAALPIAQRVCERHPEIPSQILVNGPAPWPNKPVWSFTKMSEAASTDILVTSDSDAKVDRQYLRAVVIPMLRPNTGMLTCVYRGTTTGGFWSLLDAIGMSVEMTAGVLTANFLEGMKFGLGPTIVVRRDALEAMGGYPVLGEYGPNDFEIGSKIAALGYDVLLSSYVIEHLASPASLKQMLERHLRWAIGTRYSRPRGHIGSGLVYAVPYGVMGLAAGVVLGKRGLGMGLLAWSILNRFTEVYAIGWGIARDPECARRPWLYLLRDLFGFGVWATSYLIRDFKWRSGHYQFAEGGRMLPRLASV